MARPKPLLTHPPSRSLTQKGDQKKQPSGHHYPARQCLKGGGRGRGRGFRTPSLPQQLPCFLPAEAATAAAAAAAVATGCGR